VSTPASEGTPIGPAAVVVNYNAGAYLASCLVSLRRAGAEPRVVVDNGSVDDSRRQADVADPDHRWIDSGANLGFGRGANLGVTATNTPYVLVSNPDLEIDPDAVIALVARLDAESDLGIVGPQLLNPDGTIYPSARTFPNLVDAIGHGLLGLIVPNNRFTRNYRLLDWDHRNAARVDWISGACFLARRVAWDAVGGFDPAFFMYLEDVDLCWRLSAAGWAAGYEPSARAIHVQGVSASRHPYRMLLAHHRSLWQFADRTTTGPRRWALPAVAAGLVARFGVASVQHRLSRRGSSGVPDSSRIP
jgi:N-acetylglucosaminyl-diphospho-decaprenol L-rhamnosyltransferase